MADEADLTQLLVAVANLDNAGPASLVHDAPSLATATVRRDQELFLAERVGQVYEGDTALHAAAFSSDAEMVRDQAGRGAEVRAKNRRGAEPLHAAVMGVPGSASWDTLRQGGRRRADRGRRGPRRGRGGRGEAAAASRP